jgi:hypothetical protein
MSKYIVIDAGRQKERRAIEQSTGAADADKMVRTNGDGKLHTSLLPDGVGGSEQAVIQASEALAANDLVNIHDATGPRVRKADATAEGKEVWGFVKDNVTSGANATVFFEGTIGGQTGLTPGARMYMSASAGLVTATAPTGSGNVVQAVGVAKSATEVQFIPGEPTTLLTA